MGIYSEYLDAAMNFPAIVAERKKQLARISSLRERDVLVYAADFNASDGRTGIEYSDVLPISDQLANLKGERLDFILETPGGSGEAAEDIIRLLRSRYDDLAVIVPGWAKSAGTIMAVAANEILMGHTSALGPIDAQIQWQGKRFSADALLEGFDKIKEEVESTGVLNKAYIPILQNLSPGELQSAENALGFARTLVTSWLETHKFQNWDNHTKSGEPVTAEEKHAKAEEIAGKLCDHGHWKTHARSIRRDDLLEMGLKITDYTQHPDLLDAITRYYTLMQMTFDGTAIFKLFETPTSQIHRYGQTAGVTQKGRAVGADKADFDMDCPKCGGKLSIQANFKPGLKLASGRIAYPEGDKLKCPHCQAEVDLRPARAELEKHAGQKVIV